MLHWLHEGNSNYVVYLCWALTNLFDPSKRCCVGCLISKQKKGHGVKDFFLGVVPLPSNSNNSNNSSSDHQDDSNFSTGFQPEPSRSTVTGRGLPFQVVVTDDLRRRI